MKGEETPVDERDAWEWLRNPLPPASEDALFAALRLQLGLPDQTFFTDRGFGSLGFLGQQALGQALAHGFLREHNPIVRHTVLRRRQTLENAGLLEKVGVDIHPDPDAPATAYTGVGKSGLFRGEDFASVERENIKAAVKKREVRLLIATDAGREGLNLQTLGTLINVDLPWNPSRLEQRLGRIKRLGQARRTVDMLNLVYHETQDEQVYQVISRRMKDRYDIFGGLPDTIGDEWIETVETLEEMMDEYIHLRQQARDVFEMRYQETIDPDKDRWELCSRVLARRDVVDRLSAPW